MKKILGIDLGTTSIGWAMVWEAENKNENSSIIRLGTRVIPISTDEDNDFKKGKSISINENRTLKRGARRNLDRSKQRRNSLIDIFKQKKIISENFVYSEQKKKSTFETYKIRAKATKEKISLHNVAKVLLMISKKRGYKSSRKLNTNEKGTLIDGMEVAKYMYNNNLTPGQYVYKKTIDNKEKRISFVPTFYSSDLKNELNKVWSLQKQFYPDILTDDFKKQIEGKNKKETTKNFLGKYKIYTAENKGKRDQIKLQAYKWRSQAVEKQLDIKEVAFVIAEINNNLSASSEYLGAISDRSKELYFNNQTVGEYLYLQIKNNPHARLKDQVFYRQDYEDEFEKIWETQKKFHNELTEELKIIIKQKLIFYQRPLKSQKGLLSFCEFENFDKDFVDKQTGEITVKRVGSRVIPKSSPLFQEFKIWQILNNLVIKVIDKDKTKRQTVLTLLPEEKNILFKELNICEKLTNKQVLEIIGKNNKQYELNYEEIAGNTTYSELFNVFEKILEIEGKDFKISKKKSRKAEDKIEFLKQLFAEKQIDTTIFDFDADMDKKNYHKQSILHLWHLLYSFEGDGSKTGNQKLIEKLMLKFNFPEDYAKLIANISFKNEYGSLSAKAIRKILHYIKAGNKYDVACMYAGYNHSHSKTKEELKTVVLDSEVEPIKKNSLRNPVVEKILNQMVNVINAIINDKELGKPDEIRIELARELKYSAKERAKMTKGISEATKNHEKIAKILAKAPFNISKVTRNDIIRYKLYQELETNGHKTLYTNSPIALESLFSKEIDIEHIIPKARVFDDSFSNKTLAIRSVNLKKADDTAFDFLKNYLNQKDFEQYLARVELMYKNKNISKAKYQKLLLKNNEINDGFIDRDLRNSQYIVKKAKQMLEKVVRNVNTTTGKITDRLRRDWQIVNVMKDLNFDKYKKAELIETITGKDGKLEQRIKDWTKRNDHRHHAMDALAVAFTTYSHVQYLNNLNARKDEKHEKYHSVYDIEKKYLHRNKRNKLVFIPPMPLNEFRQQAKNMLENILVSFKAKNKVTTTNRNKVKGTNKIQKTKTPRGQLHEETVYGKIDWSRIELNHKITKNEIENIRDKNLKIFIKKQIYKYGSVSKAFAKNNLKNIIYNNKQVEEITVNIPIYTKRIEIDKFFTDGLKTKSAKEKAIKKIIDPKIREIMQNRLEKYDGDFKKAFANIEQNPVWLTKPKEENDIEKIKLLKPHEKGIRIKRLTMKAVSNAIPLHYKKDHNGKFILDSNNKKIPVDFVSTGNNHLVAIYRDKKGKMQENLVNFIKAVNRKNLNLPVVDKELNKKDKWKFLFTMKKNEYFVFPNIKTGFDPNKTDLLNPDNIKLISPNLFRVQSIAKRNYIFNHHYETKSADGTLFKTRKQLKGVTYYLISTPANLEGIVKVRINHIGKIVQVGEY